MLKSILTIYHLPGVRFENIIHFIINVKIVVSISFTRFLTNTSFSFRSIWLLNIISHKYLRILWFLHGNVDILAFFQNYTEVLSGMIIEYNLFYIQLGDLKQNHAIIIHKTFQMIQIRPGISYVYKGYA